MAKTNPALTVLSADQVRQRIIDNAHKTGKDAFPLTTMGVAMVEAALR